MKKTVKEVDQDKPKAVRAKKVKEVNPDKPKAVRAKKVKAAEAEAPEIEVPDFKTIADVLKDPFYVHALEVLLGRLQKARDSRPQLLDGGRYRRDWVDRLEVYGDLSASYFISKAEEIWDKESILSSELNGIIKYYCEQALAATLAHYTRKK